MPAGVVGIAGVVPADAGVDDAGVALPPAEAGVVVVVVVVVVVDAGVVLAGVELPAVVVEAAPAAPPVVIEGDAVVPELAGVAVEVDGVVGGALPSMAGVLEQP